MRCLSFRNIGLHINQSGVGFYKEHIELNFQHSNFQYDFTLSMIYQFNKLTSVFYASVLFLIMNFALTLSKQPSGSADYFDDVMTKFIVKNRTDALKTGINLFFAITDCRISRSRSLMRPTNFKFIVCPHIDHKIQPMSAREFLQLS